MKTLLVASLFAIAGCGNTAPKVHCIDDTGCTVPGHAGICVPGENVCAVPDASCPSGERYDATSGRGDCVPPGVAPDLGTGGDGADDMTVPATSDMASADDMATDPSSTDMAGAPRSFKLKTANTTRQLHGVYGVGADIFAVGSAGVTLHSGDTGNTWSVVSPNVTEFTGVWAASASDVYAVGDSGTICRSTNMAASWACTTAGVYGLDGIWGTASDNITVGGEHGSVYHLSATGGTWAVVTTGTAYSFEHLWGTGTTVFAPAGGGAYFTSTTSGTSWSALQQSTATTQLSGIWGTSATNIFMSGYNGTLVHTTNGGTSWAPPTTMPSGLSAVALRGVFAFGSTVYVVGSNATVLVSTDGGANFQQATIPSGLTGAELFGVWGSSATDVYIVGGASANNLNGGSVILHME